jgi:hypothetical protein
MMKGILNNAFGRLDSTVNKECWNERMYSVPDEASDVEPIPSEREESGPGILLYGAASIAGIAVGYFVIGPIVVTMLNDEDGLTLHLLHAMTTILQTIARVAGSAALECEKKYNDHVNALH